MSDVLTRLTAWLDAQESVPRDEDLPGEHAPPGDPTNEELLGQFLEHQHMLGHTAGTILRRRRTLSKLCARFPGRHFRDFTLIELEAHIAAYPAARSRHAVRSDMRVFYAWALKRGLLDRDPTRDLDRIKVPKALPKPLRPSDVEDVISVSPLEIQRRIGLGFYAGLRAGEIARLRWEDITLGDRPVIVVRGGKGGKDRVVDMHPKLAALLAGGPSSGYVFPGHRGRSHVRPATVSESVARAFSDCGFPDVVCHQLRHTFGTMLAEASGGNLVAVAAAMGHDSTQTTMGYVGWGGGTAEIIRRMFPSGSSERSA